MLYSNSVASVVCVCLRVSLVMSHLALYLGRYGSYCSLFSQSNGHMHRCAAARNALPTRGHYVVSLEQHIHSHKLSLDELHCDLQQSQGRQLEFQVTCMAMLCTTTAVEIV